MTTSLISPGISGSSFELDEGLRVSQRESTDRNDAEIDAITQFGNT